MPTGFVERTAGKSVIATQYMKRGSAFYTSVEDGITATPSSTQNNARLIGQQQSRITTAAAASGVRLPPAIPGASVAIVNDGANSVLVWPSSQAQGGIAGGDAISPGAANASFSQTVAAGVLIYYCFAAGTWRTK